MPLLLFSGVRSRGLLRERGSDGDVDFLREALRVLVEGIMDAEVSARLVLSMENGALSG